MLIRSIDFETTGEPPKTEEDPPAAVIEIGWTDVTIERHGPMLSEPNSMLVKPDGVPISVEARAIHHISEEDIADAPPITTGFLRLTAGGSGRIERPSFFCAHNADFERAFFGGGEIPFICTYKVALRVWPDAPSHSLQVLRYWLDLDLDQAAGLPAHRAGPDAYVGAALMARILSEPGAPDLDTMVRWSKGPALLPRINFGKHKGEKWSDLPSDYLRWIVDKSDLDRDAKANARHWLKQRGDL